MNRAVLIPAYKPDEKLIKLIGELKTIFSYWWWMTAAVTNMLIYLSRWRIWAHMYCIMK
ncbi:MAG: hypothetical protein IJO93_00610 [Clostridia bacterium]|nr:hypothetical protein [Clostridia bacterium]